MPPGGGGEGANSAHRSQNWPRSKTPASANRPCACLTRRGPAEANLATMAFSCAARIATSSRQRMSGDIGVSSGVGGNRVTQPKMRDKP